MRIQPNCFMRQLCPVLFVTLLILTTQVSAQWYPLDLCDTTNQADYIIITAGPYSSIVEPLATFRSSHNGFTVVIALTDSIYSTFDNGITRDSAIKAFIRYTFDYWRRPKPQFFLLAGNINIVPSHKEPGLNIPQIIQEDSIMVDHWFVEGVDTSLPASYPAAAIGRFPAWDSLQLMTTISKTLSYESSIDSGWTTRAIAVADSHNGDWRVFEAGAFSLQQQLAQMWTDTLSVHLRVSSPYYQDRNQFRATFNKGATIITFVGHSNWYQFSHTAYFTTWDVDSLSNSNKYPLCVLENQRIEKQDTLPIGVKLLVTPAKGAIAILAPSGVVFFSQDQEFRQEVFLNMAQNPNQPVGKAIWITKMTLAHGNPDHRKEMLLGDPALVIKHPAPVAVKEPPRSVPIVFTLFQNYPNPFNSSTTINYQLPKQSYVRLKVFDVLGREVARLVNGVEEHGYKSVMFDASNLSSGMYYYLLHAGNYIETKKLLLLK